MNETDPLAWWQAVGGELAPVGHVLRRAWADRWMRFHSLPESKRYPDSEDEHLVLAQRHTAVANALFRPGETLFVYRSRWGEEKLRGRRKHQVAGRQLRDTTIWPRCPPGVTAEADDPPCCVRALVTVWKPDFFEQLVRQVANAEDYAVALASPDSRNIYCPYDGGMDVFCFSVNPAALQARFSAWMSSRPDRL